MSVCNSKGLHLPGYFQRRHALSIELCFFLCLLSLRRCLLAFSSESPLLCEDSRCLRNRNLPGPRVPGGIFPSFKSLKSWTEPGTVLETGSIRPLLATRILVLTVGHFSPKSTSSDRAAGAQSESPSPQLSNPTPFQSLNLLASVNSWRSLEAAQTSWDRNSLCADQTACLWIPTTENR